MERETASHANARQEQAVGRPDNINLEQLNAPVHFIGIGGIGMSAIARLLLAKGITVTGSDQSDSEILHELERLGAKTFTGHVTANAVDAGVVVVSTAISPTNPELVYAQQKNLPILHRSDLLRLLSQSSKLVAISGTHGKTTTTGMVAQILIEAEMDPSVVVGGIFERIGSNARPGKGQVFVAEADESDGTHAHVTSHIAVVTNIEADHLENYPGGLQQIKDVMTSFANNTSGSVVICQDDPGCRSIMPEIKAGKITYGHQQSPNQPDFGYLNLPGTSLRLFKSGTLLGDMTLAVPGEHNKQNALAATAVAMELGVSFAQCAQGLSSFSGVNRRFQLIGESGGIVIIDDYAHHPTEVIATLKAAKQYIEQRNETGGKKLSRVVALFQPHQPGRLRDLWEEFINAFGDADLALIGDIYVARGSNIEGITTERFVSSMSHPHVRHLPGNSDELAEKAVSLLRDGDLILTIGAGDITKVGPQILRLLQTGASSSANG